MAALAVCTAMLAIALLWLYIHMTRYFDYWKKRNVPFPKPFPFLGNIYEVIILRKSLGDLIEEIHNSTKTECAGFFAFDQPFLVIRTPQLIKQVLITDFENFDNRDFAENKHDNVSSNFLFVGRNPKWRPMRSKITPIFTTGKIKSMLPLIIEVSNDLKRYIRDVAIRCHATDSRAISLKYSTDVLLSCTIGIKGNSIEDENDPLHLHTRRFFTWTIKTTLSMLAYSIAPILVKLLNIKFVEPVGSSFLQSIFWKHMNQRENSKSPRGDLIDLLIELRKSNTDVHLDNDIIAAQPIQFMFAGVETTGSALTYAMYCLAMYPEIQRNLRQEIKEVLKRHKGITYEVFTEMKLLGRVINETLRLFPGLPWLARRCSKATRLSGTDIIVEEGIPVYISVMGLHYDPQYFPDPYKFDPDRFKSDNCENILQGTYFPFGDGPRNCIGNRFALMALKVALIQILSDFEVEVCSTTPERVQFIPRGIVLTPMDGKLDLHFKEHIDS